MLNNLSVLYGCNGLRVYFSVYWLSASQFTTTVLHMPHLQISFSRSHFEPRESASFRKDSELWVEFRGRDVVGETFCSKGRGQICPRNIEGGPYTPAEGWCIQWEKNVSGFDREGQ